MANSSRYKRTSVPPLPPVPSDAVSLGRAAGVYLYSANCQHCKHQGPVNLHELRWRLGEDFPLDQVVNTLRCSRCGAKSPVVCCMRDVGTWLPESLRVQSPRFPQ